MSSTKATNNERIAQAQGAKRSVSNDGINDNNAIRRCPVDSEWGGLCCAALSNWQHWDKTTRGGNRKLPNRAFGARYGAR
ncbi:hypothetical protein J6590_022670 [Homalodisca vitripennis]|nr:hypothetical protein J6590_022670 [Homalodisca vitripennis]